MAYPITQGDHNKARFSRLRRQPIWKQRRPIPVLMLHTFVTQLLRHLPTYLQPRDPYGANTHMQHQHNHWITQWSNVLHFTMHHMCVYSLTASAYQTFTHTHIHSNTTTGVAGEQRTPLSVSNAHILDCGFMSHLSLDTKQVILETLPKPISWLGMEKTKHNTTKAHIHQSKEMHNTKINIKTKARFSRLPRHPSWKWREPILVSALHKFLTCLLTETLAHLFTAPGPTWGKHTHATPTQPLDYIVE